MIKFEVENLGDDDANFYAVTAMRGGFKGYGSGNSEDIARNKAIAHLEMKEKLNSIDREIQLNCK